MFLIYFLKTFLLLCASSEWVALWAKAKDGGPGAWVLAPILTAHCPYRIPDLEHLLKTRAAWNTFEMMPGWKGTRESIESPHLKCCSSHNDESLTAMCVGSSGLKVCSNSHTAQGESKGLRERLPTRNWHTRNVQSSSQGHCASTFGV